MCCLSYFFLAAFLFPQQRATLVIAPVYLIWIVDHSTTDRSHSIITEATPRVRAHHSGWAIDNFFKISRNQLQVRMSGWSMLDQEHPEQLNQTRGTLWEIHPIMQIEVQQNGSWVPLDSAQL